MTQTLAMHVNAERNYGVIACEGYINQTGGEQVAEECNRLIDEGIVHLILNLERAPIVNSVGIACLFEAIERAQEARGSVAFCCLTPTLAKTFRIMRLAEATGIYETEAEAVAAVPE